MSQEQKDNEVAEKTTEEVVIANKPQKTGLLRSGMLVSLMTMCSRVLGLIRDVVLAAALGGVASGGASGAFYVAFKVPQFLRRLFAEGAFSQAFVPVLSEYQEQKTKQDIKELVDKVSGVLSLSLIFVVCLGVFFSGAMTYLVAPGFADSPDKFALTQDLLKITFPYLLLISLAGFFGAILNTYNKFAAPAASSMWLNVCLIAAGLFYANFTDNVALALAYAVTISGVIQLLFLAPFVYKLGLFPKFTFSLQHSGVRKILKLMLPALLGVSVAQINLLVDTILASFLQDGSIAWLYFSQRIADLPLGVFAVAISTVILPALSRQFSNKDELNFAPTLDWGVRFVLMISIPSVIALFVLSQAILTSFFLYGKTTALDITMSSYAMQAYSLGMMFFMMIKILVPGYYARQDMKTPVRIAIIAMVSNIFLNVLFVFPFEKYYQLGHVGLALATSLSAVLNVYLLLRGLVKLNIYQVQKGFYMQLLKYLVAGIVMGAVLFFGQKLCGNWVELNAWQRNSRLLLLCASGGMTYFVMLYLMGLRVHHFKQSV